MRNILRERTIAMEQFTLLPGIQGCWKGDLLQTAGTVVLATGSAVISDVVGKVLSLRAKLRPQQTGSSYAN